MADGRKTVLLIEDDPFMVSLLSGELSKSGFDVVFAADGEAGVEKFREAKPDAMIVDIILPKKTGLEALREIRGIPGGEEVPTVILSNLEEATYVSEAQELGAKAYLVKANVDMSEIVAKVKQALGM